MRSSRAPAVCCAAALSLSPEPAFASGHGPVFGLTTPTNASGAWAVDFAVMGRTGDGDDGAMTRAMLTYGFTEDIRLSVSAPLIFASAPFPPSRGTAMMPSSGDFEAICCALPSLLVLLGLGATVASVVSVASWLVTLSQHKGGSSPVRDC